MPTAKLIVQTEPLSYQKNLQTGENMKNFLRLVALLTITSIVLAACGGSAEVPCNGTSGTRILSVGEIGYQPNFNYDPNYISESPELEPADSPANRYIGELKQPGQTVDLSIEKCEAVAVVPDGQLGIRRGENTILQSGTYNNIPYSEMTYFTPLRIEYNQVGVKGESFLNPGVYDYPHSPEILIATALSLQPKEFAVYKKGDNFYLIDSPGFHSVPQEYSLVYSTGMLRYRLLSGSAFDDYKAANFDPNFSSCSSFACDSAVTKVMFSDSKQVGEGTIAVEALFHWDQSDPALLYELGDPTIAIQNLLISPLRGFIRTGYAGKPGNWIMTKEGREEAASLATQMLQQGPLKGSALVLDSIIIRDAWLGDAELIAQQKADQIEAANIARDQANQDSRQTLEADRREFERQQASLDAESMSSCYTQLIAPFRGMTLDAEALQVILSVCQPTTAEAAASDTQP